MQFADPSPAESDVQWAHDVQPITRDDRTRDLFGDDQLELELVELEHRVGFAS